MRKEYITRFSLALSFIMALSMTTVVLAQTPLVYIDPAMSTGNPGEYFTVNVDVQDVSNLYSYGVKIGFDSHVLMATGFSEGPFLSDVVDTAFVSKNFSSYINVGCSTMGINPGGVNGSGTLFNVTFRIKDTGNTDLDMYYAKLVDPTLTEMASNTANGYFEGASTANLVRRSAWPEHHHFKVSGDEDYNGTHANQTLNAKVKNLSPVDLYVYASFEIVRDDGFTATVKTAVEVASPGTIVNLSGDFTLSSAEVGKYAVTAACQYSFTGSYYTQGAKNKSFSFAVVP